MSIYIILIYINIYQDDRPTMTLYYLHVTTHFYIIYIILYYIFILKCMVYFISSYKILYNRSGWRSKQLSTTCLGSGWTLLMWAPLSFFVNLHIHPNVSVNVVNVVNVINPVDVSAFFSVNLSLLAFSCPFDPLNYNHHASPPNSYFPFDNYNHNHPSPLVSYDILILSNITIIFQVLLFFFLTKMIFW